VEAEPTHDVEGVELDSRRVNVAVPSDFVLGRIGGRFGMLADDDDSDDDTLEVVFAPASSLVAEAVREVSNGGGWSAQVCQKKKEIQSTRSKQQKPLVVDGYWRRPTRRWIDLGFVSTNYMPLLLACFGDALINARRDWRGRMRLVPEKKIQGAFGESIEKSVVNNGAPSRPSTWRRSNGPTPVVPLDLVMDSMGPIFGHIWSEAHFGARVKEEWPRLGVGGGSLVLPAMSGGNNGGPWTRFLGMEEVWELQTKGSMLESWCVTMD
jgi:hypothetical protein